MKTSLRRREPGRTGVLLAGIFVTFVLILVLWSEIMAWERSAARGAIYLGNSTTLAPDAGTALARAMFLLGRPGARIHDGDCWLELSSAPGAPRFLVRAVPAIPAGWTVEIERVTNPHEVQNLPRCDLGR